MTIYLNDVHKDLIAVVKEVVADPIGNWRALCAYPTHECSACSDRSKVVAAAFGALAQDIQRGFNSASTQFLCSSLASCVAALRGDTLQAILTFLSTYGIVHLVPKVIRVVRSVLGLFRTAEKIGHHYFVVRRQLVRFVLAALVCSGGAYFVSAIAERLKSDALPNLSDEVEDVSGVSDFFLVIATLLTSVFGVRTLGRHFNAFVSLINCFDLRVALRKSMTCFLATCIDLLRKVVSFFSKRFDERLLDAADRWRVFSQKLSQRKFDETLRLANNILSAKGSNLGFIGTPELERNINSAIANIVEGMGAGASTAQVAAMQLKIDELCKLREESLWVASLAKQRQPPVVCCLMGAPGVGKSYAVNLLIEAAYDRLCEIGVARRYDDRPCFFTRNSDCEFFDGYAGQEILYYSDIFRSTCSKEQIARESLARELSELQSLVDTAPYYPPFAFEPSPRRYGKGIPIAPKLVVLTTNYHTVETFGDAYILGRRIHNTYMFVERDNVPKQADLSHLRVFRKRSPYMSNGPATGGKPFSNGYTPENQFPRCESELESFPWLDDFEEVALTQLVDDIVDRYVREQAVFKRSSSVNPFCKCSGKDSNCEELTLSLPYDGPDDIPDHIIEFGEFDFEGVKVKFLCRGRKCRVTSGNKRRIYCWDSSRGRYVYRRQRVPQEIDLPSSGMNCFFRCLQCFGVCRSLSPQAMREKARAILGDKWPDFVDGAMVSSDTFSDLAIVFRVNIFLTLDKKSYCLMNEYEDSFTNVYIRHNNNHFTAVMEEEDYDGWRPVSGGALSGRYWDTIARSRRVLLGPYSLDFLLGFRSVPTIDALDCVVGNDRHCRVVEMSCDEATGPVRPTDWCFLVDSGSVYLATPEDLADRFCVIVPTVAEALSGTPYHYLQREQTNRVQGALVLLRGTDKEVLGQISDVLGLPYHHVLAALGLYVRPVEDGSDEIIEPFVMTGYHILQQSVASWSAATLGAKQCIRNFEDADLVTMDPWARRVVGCIRSIRRFVEDHKILVSVFSAFGIATVAATVAKRVRRGKRNHEEKSPTTEFTQPDDCVHRVSETGKYILLSASTMTPPSNSILNRLKAKFWQIKAFVSKDKDAVIAEIPDLPKFNTICPDLWAEPLSEIDLQNVPASFKMSLFRPSNFPRVSLVRDGVELSSVVGMHLARGIVVFPNHVVDGMRPSDVLRIDNREFNEKSIVKLPFGPHIDLSCVPGAHNGFEIPTTGFSQHAFNDKVPYNRDLLDVWVFRNGVAMHQKARLADTSLVERPTKHGNVERKVAGYLVLGCDVRPGDCGSLLLYKGQIVGILSAGIPGQESIWTPILRQNVSDLCRDYGDATTPTSCALAALSSGRGIFENENVRRISGFHVFSQSEKFDAPYEPKRTEIADLLDPERYWLPAPISYKSYKKTLSRFPVLQPGDMPDEVVESVRDYFDRDLHTYQELPSWTATANGCSDEQCTRVVLKKVVLDTSPGKPFTEPYANVSKVLPEHLCSLTDKKKLYRIQDGKLVPIPELVDMADRCYEQLRRGIVPRCPFTFALKREIRDRHRVQAGKCRLFIMPPHHLNLAIRRVLGEWAGVYKRDGVRMGHAIGINCHSQLEWGNLMTYLSRGGFKVIAPDFSGYDVCHPIALNQLIAKQLSLKYPEESRKAVRACFLACNVMECYDSNSQVVTTGQASGSQITTQVNCVYSNVIFRAALYSIFKTPDGEVDKAFIEKNFRLVCYGDDCLLAGSPQVLKDYGSRRLVADICAFAKRLGYTLTNGDKGVIEDFVPVSKCRFLKRSFEYYDGCVRAPLPPENLAKGVCYFDGEATMEDEFRRSSLRALLMEIAEQTNNDYTRRDWRKRIEEVCKQDPAWSKAFASGCEAFYERCMMWKKVESDYLLKNDRQLCDVVFPHGCSDSYGRSAWSALPQ